FAGALSSSSMLLLPPQRWLDDAESCDCPPEYLADLVRACKAQDVLFYAENGEELFRAERDRSEYLRNVSFLWRPREAIAARLATDAGVRVTQAVPYLRVILPVRGPAVMESPSPAS
ncbi:MAG TPA: hypothetical protein VKW04_19630, partial [Planctomycetota bacterium]|nr:hypothetical protein [Planctomycetota bacterium]